MLFYNSCNTVKVNPYALAALNLIVDRASPAVAEAIKEILTCKEEYGNLLACDITFLNAVAAESVFTSPEYKLHDDFARKILDDNLERGKGVDTVIKLLLSNTFGEADKSISKEMSTRIMTILNAYEMDTEGEYECDCPVCVFIK